MTNPGDVSSTLGELERKLRDLEQELHSVGRGAPAPAAPVPEHPAAAPAPPPVMPAAAPPPPQFEPAMAPAPPMAAPPPPPPAAEAFAPPPPPPEPGPPSPHDVWSAPPAPASEAAEVRASVNGLQEQLGELLAFREKLERTAHELMDEYQRVLGRVHPGAAQVGSAPLVPPQPPPAPAAAPPYGTTPAPAPYGTAPAAGAPALGVPPAPPAATAAVPDETLFEGEMTIDAGPFDDIAVLSSFEQALGRIPGMHDVYVRGFEGDRAHIDVALAAPTAIGGGFRRVAPVGFTLTGASASHLSIQLDHHG